MSTRTFLPAIPENGNGNGHGAMLPAGASMAGKLQEALARVVSDAEIEAIVKQIVEEAKNGTAAEKNKARQMLFGLLGTTAKPAATTTNVQNNYYSTKVNGRKKSGGICSQIVRYLESDGPQPLELIASSVSEPKAEVLATLEGNPSQFIRVRGPGGAAWGLAKKGRAAS